MKSHEPQLLSLLREAVASEVTSAVLALLTPKEHQELAKEGGLDLRDKMAEIALDSLAGMEWDDEETVGGDGGGGGGGKKRKNGWRGTSIPPGRSRSYRG